jgi:hypothetical protein
MALRVGFDMDGVLADFAAAFSEVEARLFVQPPSLRAGQPETEERARSKSALPDSRSRDAENQQEARRRRDAVWAAIDSTPDFWTTLRPTAAGAVARIHALMRRHRWEVFFITQRPDTEGDTVQRQTQRWLVEQGFDLPSVLVIDGSRGAAAAALRLDYHVDDSPENCLDVMAAAGARPILICEPSDQIAANARKLGIGIAADIEACLDILEEASAAQSNPTLLERLAALVGWR